MSVTVARGKAEASLRCEKSDRGARLTDPNIGRALMDWILFELGDEILEAAKEASGTLRRPPADDPAAMAEFDEALKEIVRAGAVRRRG